MLTKKTRNKLITSENLEDFDWNKTKLFYHIAKCGGFVKAALLTGVSQGALTRQIQYLENQVGCKLLIRRPGGITLTRKGEQLLEMVGAYFLGAKGFCGPAYVEVIRGEKKRRIRIVTTNAIATYVISDLVMAYNKNNPHLLFEIIGEDHEIDVILNDADIVIRPYDSEARNVQQEHLFTLEKKLYASREYLEKYGEPKTVDDLKDHYFITASSNPKYYPYADIHWILKLGMPEGKKHIPVFLSNSIECMINAAKEGIGIIGGYETMSIIRNSNLKNILPDIKDKLIEEHFIYPDHLKEDQEIMGIKNYLMKNIVN